MSEYSLRAYAGSKEVKVTNSHSLSPAIPLGLFENLASKHMFITITAHIENLCFGVTH